MLCCGKAQALPQRNGKNAMKKFFTLFTLTSILACLGVASDQSSNIVVELGYTGPDEKSVSSDYYTSFITLGLFAQAMNVGAVADVVNFDPPTTGYSNGSLTLRVVNAIYGCTNGQELVVAKENATTSAEYYPTNNSRIVFTGLAMDANIKWGVSTARDWKLPPQPEIIHSPTNVPIWLVRYTRSWWHEGYQDNLPYTYLTNLVHAARVERNWTNYYHVVRDALPTPSSPRVWMDAYADMYQLLRHATEAQFEYMSNDPLFPAECQTMKQVVFAEHQVNGFPTDD